MKTAASVLALVALAGCAGEYGQSSVDPVTDFAERIQGLYLTVTWISLAILVIVWALLAVTLVKFRERPDTPTPRQTHGHLGLEIVWTIIPAMIVVALAIPTIQTVFATQRPPEDAYVVEVIGHQFWWEFRYPEEGVVTANELHLPVDRPVSLRLHSVDVIHSFWVPQLGGKRDVNPLVARPDGEQDRHTWLHFTIREPGTYMGQCAEFCGESHSLMGMRVVAESQADFDAWLAAMRTNGGRTAPPAGGAAGQVRNPTLTGEVPRPLAVNPDPERQAAEDSATAAAGRAPADTGAASGAAPGDTAAGAAPAARAAASQAADFDPALAARGAEVFHSRTCISCHAIQGTNAVGPVGPNLTLMGRRSRIAAGWLENTVENLERWITAPASVKPGALMPGTEVAGGNWPATGLTPDEVRAVAHYLSSLR